MSHFVFLIKKRGRGLSAVGLIEQLPNKGPQLKSSGLRRVRRRSNQTGFGLRSRIGRVVDVTALQDPAPLDEVYQYHDDGDDQQDVD
jgi:hypothetical protein